MLLRKRAWDIMRPPMSGVSIGASVAEAMRVLDAVMATTPDCHTILVETEDGDVAGSLSIWDVLRHLDAAMGRDPDLRDEASPGHENTVRAAWARLAATPLVDIMDPHVPLIAPGDPLSLVLEKMLLNGRTMAVVTDAGKVLGTLHVDDVYAMVSKTVAAL
ncbi:MAG: CBS domain-containing protein [Desulfovibrionaceae bacterium]